MKRIATVSLTAIALTLLSCKGSHTAIGVEEFDKVISAADVTVVDLRSEEEFLSGRHIPGALNIPYSPAFADSAASKIKPGGTVAIYADAGTDCAKASDDIRKKGLGTPVSLAGGLQAWKDSGKRVCDKWDYIVFEGDKAPDFEVEVFERGKEYPEGYDGKSLKGERIRLSDLKGKVVMIQFTASWCGVCAREMPHIEKEIWQRFKDNPDFVLVGLDRDESWEKLSEFIKATGITYPLAFDPKAKVFDSYAVHDAGITRNVLVGKDGTIVHRTRLYNPTEFQVLVDRIEALLKDK